MTAALVLDLVGGLLTVADSAPAWSDALDQSVADSLGIAGRLAAVGLALGAVLGMVAAVIGGR